MLKYIFAITFITFLNKLYCCCLCNVDKNKIAKDNLVIKYQKYDKSKNSFQNNEEKYFLNSGLDIKIPLNLKWDNYNCAAISILRFFLSEKHLLDKIINKNNSNYDKFNKMEKKKLLDIENKKSNLDLIKDKFSKLFSDIKKYEKIYNLEYEEIFNLIGVSSNICDSCSLLMKLILYLFPEDFVYFKKKGKYFPYTFIDITYGSHDINEKVIDIINLNDYIILHNSDLNMIKVKENLEIEKNNNLYKYELVGIIGLCGNVKELKVDKTDTVVIVPVFDKNKNKLGYIKYQFNDMSNIKQLDEWNQIDNFGNWPNPRFFLMIYKLVNK